jgi:heme/copper-type cytochrome/quinol oxidase subunit 2
MYRKWLDKNPRVGGLQLSCLVAVGFLIFIPRPVSPQSSQVIEVLADHDSRFKMTGMKEPVITVHAGALVTLRVRAVKAKNHNRDGSIHGFSLLRAKDRSPVPGWDLLLKPGMQEFTLTTPAEPGEYVVVCTVVCSPDHDGMHMRFIVLP